MTNKNFNKFYLELLATLQDLDFFLLDSKIDKTIDQMKQNPIIGGETKVDRGSDENGEWTRTTYLSKDGAYRLESFVRTPKTKSKSEIGKLKKQLQECVELQEFEKAAKLRDQIKDLEKNQQKMTDLQSQLDDAIRKENFELAIQLRDQIKELKTK